MTENKVKDLVVEADPRMGEKPSAQHMEPEKNVAESSEGSPSVEVPTAPKAVKVKEVEASVDKKKVYEGITFEELCRLATKGASDIGFDFNFEDENTRRKFVDTLEEKPRPWTHGPISTLFRLAFSILTLPARLMGLNFPFAVLPREVVAPKGFPVPIDAVHDQELTRTDSTRYKGETSCKVERKDIVHSAVNNPVITFKKVLLGGKEMDYDAVVQSFEEKYGKEVDSARFIAFITDLAMLNVHKDGSSGRDVIKDRITKLHGEILYEMRGLQAENPALFDEVVSEAAQAKPASEPAQAAQIEPQAHYKMEPSKAEAPKVEAPPKKVSRDSGLIMGMTTREDDEHLASFLDESIEEKGDPMENRNVQSGVRYSKPEQAADSGMRM